MKPLDNTNRIAPKLKIIVFTLLFIFLALAVPKHAHAGLGDAIGKVFLSITGFIFGKVAWIIGLIIGLFTGLLFSLAGVLLDWGVALNQNITSSPLVLSGFGISLSIANLGFVLAIIFMAFTTILRLGGYGLKQTLWKLVVAAVLVNFSLTIAGVIIDFTGVLGDYFISKATGNGLGLSVYIADVMDISAIQAVNQSSGANVVGQTIEGLLSVVGSLFFSVIFTVLGFITMMGLAGMFLIRYLILSILLILMPLAWLFWVLPGLEGHFKNWWGTFIKWTLFLPAAAFFLYLTILTLKQIPQTVKIASVQPKQLQTGTLAGYSQMLLSIGMIMGAMIVANKMSLVGSDAVLSRYNKIQSWAQGKMWQGTKTGAGALYRFGSDKSAKAYAERTGQEAKPWSERLTNYAKSQTGVRGFMARTFLAPAAQGLAAVEQASTKDLVKDNEARMKDMSENEVNAVLAQATGGPKALQAINGPKLVAALKWKLQNDKISYEDALQYLNEETESIFRRNNEGKAFEDMKKATGMDIATAKNLNAGDFEAAKQSMANYYATMSYEDGKKISVNNILEAKDASGQPVREIGKIFAHALASAKPGFMATLMPKMKKLDKFKELMVGAGYRAGQAPGGAIGALAGDRQAEAQKTFDKMLSRLNRGFDEPEQEMARKEESPTPPPGMFDVGGRKTT